MSNKKCYALHTRVQVMLFWTWLNTYFVSSSSPVPVSGSPAGGPPSDQWRPVPSRTGARHDGSDPGMRYFVTVLGVGETGDATGLASGGRCITVSLPQPELDRIRQSSIDDVVKPNFMVRLQLLHVKCSHNVPCRTIMELFNIELFIPDYVTTKTTGTFLNSVVRQILSHSRTFNDNRPKITVLEKCYCVPFFQ